MWFIALTYHLFSAEKLRSGVALIFYLGSIKGSANPFSVLKQYNQILIVSELRRLDCLLESFTF